MTCPEFALVTFNMLNHAADKTRRANMTRMGSSHLTHTCIVEYIYKWILANPKIIFLKGGENIKLICSDGLSNIFFFEFIFITGETGT